jgi:tetratricopeptide (TPR) repeat protein
MSRKDNVKKLIAEHNRHLQKLKEQEAKWGLNAPTHILTEIEDRENEIERLKTELENLAESPFEIDQDSDEVLHNLPQPDYEHFIGRQAELKQIRQLLLPHPKSRHFVITIDGIGGIGKSALALEVADSYRRHFDKLPEEERFEAIIWTTAKQTVLTGEGIITRQQSLRNLTDIYTAIAVTLEREDITRARTDEQDNLVRQALTQQRTLLIIDNLETVDDERVKSFINELPDPTKVIATTRHRLDVAYPVRLMGMAKNEGLELIADEAKLKGVTITLDEAKHLFKRTGGVPLAIVWTVAQMGFGYRLETIFDRLGQPTNDIAKFCFEAAIERIQNRPAQKLLMALSMFATDASRDALGYVANLSVLDRDDGLVDLEKLSLVNKKDDRFSFLPLTKSFALAELNKNSDSTEEMRRRWLDYLRTLCKVTGEYYWRYESYTFHDDADTILEAVDWSYGHGTAKHGNAQDIFILTLAAYDYLEAVGQWNTILELCYKALDLARSIQDGIYIARFCSITGWILTQRGEYEDAASLFDESLNEYKMASVQEGEGIALQHLSTAYRKQKMFEKAKQLNDDALKIAENLGFGDLEALVNTNFGKLARDMGDWNLAWAYFTKVRDYFEGRVEETPRDEPLARSTWGHLAIVAYHLGRPEQAKELCLRSLKYFEVRGTKGYLATLKYRLALAEEALPIRNETILKTE